MEISKPEKLLIIQGSFFFLYLISLRFKHRSDTHLLWSADFRKIIVYILLGIYIIRLINYLYFKWKKELYKNEKSIYNRWDRLSSMILLIVVSYTYYSWIIHNKETKRTSKLAKIIFVILIIYLLPGFFFIWDRFLRKTAHQPDPKMLMEGIGVVGVIYADENETSKEKMIEHFKSGIYENVPNIDKYQLFLIKDYETSTLVIVLKNIFYEEIIVIFKATKEQEDIKTDIRALDRIYEFPMSNSLVKNSIRGEMKIHRGFYDAYKSIRDALFIHMKSAKTYDRIKVYGHSLGGSLATLFAFDLVANINTIPIKNANKLHIYTYGSPSVGDTTFTNIFDKYVKNSFRTVNGMDPVPLLTRAHFSHVQTVYMVYDPYIIPGRLQHGRLSYIQGLKLKQGNKISIYVVYAIAAIVIILLLLSVGKLITYFRK